MLEIHVGTKPGRPKLLLLLSAGVLVLTLGLAWLQVRGSRALGERVRIAGTPLVVRPPAGWTAAADDPGLFVKTIAVEYRGRQREVVERSIRFQYRRWRVFQPLPFLLRVSNWIDDKQAYQPDPGQIGGLAGVQVRRGRAFRWRGQTESGESIYRLVSTARGDQISVEYTPLGKLAPGDLELFDAVCRAARLDDAALSAPPGALLEHCGLEFPAAENWTLLGPDFPGIRGLYVQANDADGIPTWGLGVFRTWLAAGRRPADLLQSLIELHWPPAMVAVVEPRESVRADGALLAWVSRPAFEGSEGCVAAAWVVAESPTAAALILVLADRGSAAEANRAAERLVTELSFTTPYPAQGVEAAERRGRQLVGLLQQRGLVHWWGHEEWTGYYLGEVAGEILGRILDQPVLVQSWRAAVDGDAPKGYEGFDLYLLADPSDDQRRRWMIDAHAREYTYSRELNPTAARQPPLVRLRESWNADEAIVRRTILLETQRRQRVEIPVGQAFVPPPIEPLAQAWVAQQEAGEWLIEVSPLSGSTATTQLVVPLGLDEEGRRRALVVDDYWPRGMVLAFDDRLELVSETAPVGRFERISAAQARRVLRAMGR